jgi:hypothetical protein
LKRAAPPVQTIPSTVPIRANSTASDLGSEMSSSAIQKHSLVDELSAGSNERGAQLNLRAFRADIADQFFVRAEANDRAAKAAERIRETSKRLRPQLKGNVITEKNSLDPEAPTCRGRECHRVGWVTVNRSSVAPCSVKPSSRLGERLDSSGESRDEIAVTAPDALMLVGVVLSRPAR